jgi:hypothetical protein
MTAAHEFRQAPSTLADRLRAAIPRRAQAGVAGSTTSQAGTDVRLRVLRGRHQGAEAELLPGRINIGSSLDGDIVLTDRGVSAQHVVVELAGNPGARTLALSAVGAGVLVAGEELAVGATKSFAMPVTIDIADAGLEFIDPVPRTGGVSIARMARASVVLPAAVVAGMGVGALGSWLATPATLPNFTPRPGPTAPLAGQPTAQRLGVAPLTDAARIMERQLMAAGLDKQIRVAQRDNVLVAEGTLSIDAHPKWRAIKAAVREGVSERLLIADMVKPLEAGDSGMRAMIAAVTGGKSPAVIGVNGKRAGPGETLIDGWIVKQITAEAVQLERGGSKVTVKLSP